MSNLSKTFIYQNEKGDSITFEYDSGYLINKPSGIDSLTVSLSEAQGIGQTGSTIQSVNVKSRPVVINGIITGLDSTLKDKLLSVVRPDLSGKLFAGELYLEVRPTTTPTIEARERFPAFQFSLLAAYPYWQKDAHASASLAGVRKAFKFPWKINANYRYGEVIAAQVIGIDNAGQVPIPFTVTFKALGAVTNPKLLLLHDSGNETLLLNKTLIAGEIVTIEITHERTYVESSVDGECRGALDLASDFYRLAVGENVIKPEAQSGASNMQVDIRYALEYVGVTV